MPVPPQAIHGGWAEGLGLARGGSGLGTERGLGMERVGIGFGIVDSHDEVVFTAGG